MVRVVLGVLALFVADGFSDPLRKIYLEKSGNTVSDRVRVLVRNPRINRPFIVSTDIKSDVDRTDHFKIFGGPKHHEYPLSLLDEDSTVGATEPNRLNQRFFELRTGPVQSKVAKRVEVVFFLVPKYDSYGFKIPLQVDTHNFYQLDEFVGYLPQGDSVITRYYADNIGNWDRVSEVYDAIIKAIDDQTEGIEELEGNLLLSAGEYYFTSIQE